MVKRAMPSIQAPTRYIMLLHPELILIIVVAQIMHHDTYCNKINTIILISIKNMGK